MFGALDRLPINKEGDGVLGLRYAVIRVTGCNTRGCTSNYAGRDGEILKNPAAYINVVGREVITFRMRQRRAGALSSRVIQT